MNSSAEAYEKSSAANSGRDAVQIHNGIPFYQPPPAIQPTACVTAQYLTLFTMVIMLIALITQTVCIYKIEMHSEKEENVISQIYNMRQQDREDRRLEEAISKHASQLQSPTNSRTDARKSMN